MWLELLSSARKVKKWPLEESCCYQQVQGAQIGPTDGAFSPVVKSCMSHRCSAVHPYRCGRLGPAITESHQKLRASLRWLKPS